MNESMIVDHDLIVVFCKSRPTNVMHIFAIIIKYTVNEHKEYLFVQRAKNISTYIQRFGFEWN